MPWREFAIPFPVLGVSENWRATSQPPLTTPDALNARGRDPVTGRVTLAQRPGLTKYNSSQINGANPIQEMVPFVKDSPGLGTFAYHAAASSVTMNWSAKLPSTANIGDNLTAMCVDRQGNVYAIAGDTGIIKINADGEEVWFHPVELEDEGWTIRDIRLDPLEENLYICVGGSGSNGIIIRYELTDDGPVKRWAIVAPNSGLFASLAVGYGYLYAIENVSSPNSYFHRWEAIDTEEPVHVWSSGKGHDQQGSHVEIGPDGSAYVSYDADGVTSEPSVIKYDGAGDVVWEFQPPGEGGHGYGAVFHEGHLYTVGPDLSQAGNVMWVDTKVLRKIRDDGSAATAVASLTTSAVPETTYKGNSLAVDGGGRLFYVANSGASTNLVLISDTLAVVWSHSTTNNVGEPNVVALDPWSPDGERAEYVYVGGTRRSSDTHALFKLKVGAYPNSLANASPRTLQVLAVANGAARVFTSSAVATPADAGTYTLSTSKQYIQGLFAYRRVFIIDGQNDVDRQYDPYTGSNGTMLRWTATRGRFTPRPKVLGLHNGRLVRARFPTMPQFWEMTKVGDPYDMDVYPVEQSPDQAVNGVTSQAGLCPDIINAWINWQDDLSIVGGDHSIWRLTGDPAAGGRFDLVSDTVGIAFGRAWCKAPDGTVYFFGSRGGVYAMPPGGLPQRLRGATDSDDENSIDARLAAVNLGTHKVMLAWNDSDRGLHVFITPYTSGATTHYFWDARQRAWWPDKFPNDMCPLAVAVADGDSPTDRVMLLGGHDGYVRYPKADATSDDGTAVESYVVCGPYLPGGLEAETRLSGLRAVVASVTAAQTVDFGVYAAEDPDWAGAGAAVFSGTGATGWADGRNDWLRERARGHALWIKLGRYAQSQAVGRWAMESLAARVEEAGIVRNR